MSQLSTKSAFLRFACIVLCVCIADGLIVVFYPKPFPLVTIISSMTPLFVVCLIVIPNIRANPKGFKDKKK